MLMETPDKRVLNVGFGMGIIDTAFQKWNPALHIIIEAHPDVYQRMLDEKWDEKPNVRICFGKWQDVLPKLIQEGVMVDGIFYDTYGEHFLDLEDFHNGMVQMLSKPHGVYSFFNGLAPDNIFFHGVGKIVSQNVMHDSSIGHEHTFIYLLFVRRLACQCVKLQLGQLGLHAEFLPCELQVEDSVWEGIRRKYWHGRDTYYLPRVTWKPAKQDDGQLVADEKKNPSTTCPDTAPAKRQKTENDI
jgi:protein arginine N-methyltransferase 2